MVHILLKRCFNLRQIDYEINVTTTEQQLKFIQIDKQASATEIPYPCACCINSLVRWQNLDTRIGTNVE